MQIEICKEKESDEELCQAIMVLKECLSYCLLDKVITINDNYGNFTEKMVNTFQQRN